MSLSQLECFFWHCSLAGPTDEKVLLPPLANARDPPDGSIVVNVVIVEPPPALGGMLVVTDSWTEAVVKDIPELEDVGVNRTLPANAKAPPLDSMLLQAAIVVSELYFGLAPRCI